MNVPRRASTVLSEELGPWRPVIRLSLWLIGLLPSLAFIRLRTRALRLVGWDIAADAAVFGVPRLYGLGPIKERFVVGPRAMVNVGCTIELNDRVEIGADAALGHDVVVLTSTHRLGGRRRRAAELERAPVRIGAGAWIGARSTILPGVEVGDGAVVMAGSVVNADVPPRSLVSGVPATVTVRRLPG